MEPPHIRPAWPGHSARSAWSDTARRTRVKLKVGQALWGWASSVIVPSSTARPLTDVHCSTLGPFVSSSRRDTWAILPPRAFFETACTDAAFTEAQMCGVGNRISGCTAICELICFLRESDFVPWRSEDDQADLKCSRFGLGTK